MNFLKKIIKGRKIANDENVSFLKIKGEGIKGVH